MVRAPLTLAAPGSRSSQTALPACIRRGGEQPTQYLSEGGELPSAVPSSFLKGQKAPPYPPALGRGGATKCIDTRPALLAKPTRLHRYHPERPSLPICSDRCPPLAPAR